MFSDWLDGGILMGDVKEFKNKIRCVALSSSLVFTSENMSTASSSSSSYNSASSSMLAMDSDSKELDEILARYERAANFYKLLDSSKLVYKPGKFGREEVFKLLTVDTATSLKFVTFGK
ncbi:hypothetical protein NQ315_005937 [Exocentrus adspersus]|uniref:Uncharacterized protein n=1 Tax=Exocentrus adspersus TaxID=1586481 RepID=A0AAV8VDR1_9CUCU|nr:hypothetical protein NQ315_005937 [Exocentrus adspersus]